MTLLRSRKRGVRRILSGMKTPGLHRRSVAASGLIALASLLPLPVTAQNPPADDPALLRLIEEIAEQSRQIEANQKAIDARIAEIEEAVRQARIFAARSGRKGGGE